MTAETIRDEISRAQWKQKQPAFRLMTVPEVLAAPPPSWTVEGIVTDRGIGVIFGASGSGKTFAALDLACAIARDIPWHGCAVKGGSVVYVATEGRIAGRLDAYMRHHDIVPDALTRLRVLESRVNLLEPDADLPQLIESIKAANLIELKLVIVDTLNRAMPGGNENASEDMGRMIDAASAVVAAMGCTFVYIHHSGKEEAKGSRGHSSLKAATEFELSVRRNGDTRDIQVEKVRDDEDGYTLATFSLQPVGSSVVVVPTEARATKRARNAITNAERVALDALEAAMIDHRTRRAAPASLLEHGAKVGQYVVTIEHWKDALFARLGADIEPASKRRNFQRVREGLQSKGRVVIHEEFAWLA